MLLEGIGGPAPESFSQCGMVCQGTLRVTLPLLSLYSSSPPSPLYIYPFLSQIFLKLRHSRWLYYKCTNMSAYSSDSPLLSPTSFHSPSSFCSSLSSFKALGILPSPLQYLHGSSVFMKVRTGRHAPWLWHAQVSASQLCFLQALGRAM